MGETRVDLLHLLEDLRDAYPGSLEETILTEIVANSLDSGADTIVLRADPVQRQLNVIDNGRGMAKRELRRYHDLAASTKRRGKGIGFAGVGIKLGLLACDRVITETQRGNERAASEWHLGTKQRAPWHWIEPAGLVAEQGTAVQLRLDNPLSPLLDPGFIAATLEQHFQTLLDPSFESFLEESYPRGILFLVNGLTLAARMHQGERAELQVRIGRKRKPAAVGYLVRSTTPLHEAEQGLGISTLGKVIKRGWDWLGVTPADPARVAGLIEAPALAEVLTLSKSDFQRTGSRGALLVAYRKAIQEVVGRQLAAWGDAPEPSGARRPRTRPIERDLRNVLADLADAYPLLSALVERKAGGQRRLAFATAADPSGEDWAMGLPPNATAADGPPSAGDSTHAPSEKSPSAQEEPPPGEEPSGQLPGRASQRRPTKLQLQIQFENRPDDESLGRLIESTVWVNEAHPAYQRALAARSEGYHVALTVAMTLAPLAVDAAQTHGFVNAFLASWGEAAADKRKSR